MKRTTDAATITGARLAGMIKHSKRFQYAIKELWETSLQLHTKLQSKVAKISTDGIIAHMLLRQLKCD